MDYRTMFDKQHLGAWDLVDRKTGKPRDFTLTISKVVAGTLQKPGTSKKNRKPLISFEGATKTLACNATNAATIAGMYGNDTRAWVGKRITLYPTTTKFGGDVVDCIRIRPVVPGSGVKTDEELEGREPDPEMRERQNAAEAKAEAERA